MTLRPCFRCPNRRQCTRELEIREKLRGSGVTSAKFSCDIYQSLFAKGDVVEISVLIEDPWDVKYKRCEGIVVAFDKRRDGKVTIHIPEAWTRDLGGEIRFRDEGSRRGRMVRYWPAPGADRWNSPVRLTGRKVDLDDFICRFCGQLPECGWMDEYRTCGKALCMEQAKGEHDTEAVG